jgi:hypothetical protein
MQQDTSEKQHHKLQSLELPLSPVLALFSGRPVPHTSQTLQFSTALPHPRSPRPGRLINRGDGRWIPPVTWARAGGRVRRHVSAGSPRTWPPPSRTFRLRPRRRWWEGCTRVHWRGAVNARAQRGAAPAPSLTPRPRWVRRAHAGTAGLITHLAALAA